MNDDGDRREDVTLTRRDSLLGLGASRQPRSVREASSQPSRATTRTLRADAGDVMGVSRS